MPGLNKRKLLQGSASNFLRTLLSMVVSLLLPHFLVHRMSTAEYSAWILILQLAAYVNFLDFGLQTAIGKFVAEYDATGNTEASQKVVSTAFSILSVAAGISALVIGGLAMEMPRLFHQMPASLLRDTQLGVLAVGLSMAITLPTGALLATFTGLQEYGFPTLLLTGSRLLSAGALVWLVFMHGSLIEMAMTIAAFNLLTGLGQYLGWKRYASERAPLRFLRLDRSALRMLTEYCGVLTLWTIGGLLISGFDTTIVAHYDYKNTGFYATGASATNFMLLLVGNLLGPLVPAISALQSAKTAQQLGATLIRTTRLCGLLLCILGLPLLVAGFPLLRLWVGRDYAVHSVVFLQILVAANVVRQLGYPYALVVVATGKQRLASYSPVVESVLNLVLSVWLASRYGAIGVACGTLVASFVGLAVHFLVSMRLTRDSIDVPRSKLLLQGIARPLVCLLPSIVLLPFWHPYQLWPMQPVLSGACLLATLALGWFVALDSADKRVILNVAGRLVS